MDAEPFQIVFGSPSFHLLCAQQLGIFDTHRVCGPGPFAVGMISKAGARAVKAQDELATLGLDRPPRRLTDPGMTAKGQAQVYVNREVL
jgi:hypothetical protein